MHHSPSSIKLFQNCPKRYFHERIMGDIDPTIITNTAAADRGNELHAQFEHGAKTGEWPDSHPQVEAWYAEQAQHYPKVALERKLALDRDFEPCQFEGEYVWVRGIADVIFYDPELREALVVDYKTGKRRNGEHTLQLAFYALATFIHGGKDVDLVTTDVYWTEDNVHETKRYRRYTNGRSNVDKLADLIRNACEHVEGAVEFPAKPTGLCRGFCPVSSCKFWKPYRQRHVGPVYSFS